MKWTNRSQRFGKCGGAMMVAVLLTFTCGSSPLPSETIKRSGQADVVSFDDDWRFIRYGLQADGTHVKEPENLFKADVDDSGWTALDVPHDFAIAGPFRMDLAGNTGRLPYQGIGWYRKTFTVDKADQGKRFYIDFDGVMAYAKVWLNGEYVGTWPYGYNSFRLDLTPYIKVGEPNVLAVRTDTEKWESRWYPGAGIYRHVWLVKTGQVHVKHWGTKMETANLTAKSADLRFSVEVESHLDQDASAVVKAAVYEVDPQDRLGKQVLRFDDQTLKLASKGCEKIQLRKTLNDCKRWDIVSPNRYMACVTVEVNGKETDRYYTPFGVREISISRKGFMLNGRRVEIKGVCNHHDLGALGAAFNLSALERQFRIMQEMGCNSIRTSHNPPAPELLDLADKTGILIMDEATASLDNETDAFLQSMIRKQFSTCTTLTIAHRLNTILDADRVCVMDAGVVAEYDSPYNLLHKESVFKGMVLAANDPNLFDLVPGCEDVKKECESITIELNSSGSDSPEKENQPCESKEKNETNS